MKANLIVSIVVLVISCNGNLANNEVSQIAGTYTHDGSNEFRVASDTLIISLYNREGNTYTIQRSTGFNRIVEGKIQQREFIKEAMNAIYDEKAKQLKETKSGRIFLFPTEKNKLVFGSISYNKIDQK